MTGIQLDLLTVILLVILSFVCGYSAGHKVGRYEVQNFVIKTMEEIQKTREEMASNKEKEMEAKKEQVTSFLKILDDLSKRKDIPKGDNQ